MGRKERKLREQQELRQSILDAARKIALSEGWRNVTMRKIAEIIEYSHAAIYDYFENKDVLFLELVREGFRIMESDLKAAQAQGADPVETLHLVGRSYMAFAWRYPELYRVMYGLDGATFSTGQTHGEGQQIEDVVVEVIQHILTSRNWSQDRLVEKVTVLWSTAHGLVTLTMADRIIGGQSAAMHLLEQSIQDNLLAWEVAASTSSPGPSSEKATSS